MDTDKRVLIKMFNLCESITDNGLREFATNMMEILLSKPMKMKKCKNCKEYKRLDEYSKQKDCKYGRKSICKSCTRKADNAKYHNRLVD